MEGVDEGVPYPRRYEAPYPRTKAQAEKLVLDASCDSLATVALRPHNIWGPGDPHIVPRIVKRARAGQLYRLGSGRNVVDTTYVENAAEAHLLAAERLTPRSPSAGRPYFLSQGDPRPLWEFINDVLAAAALPSVTKSIPAPVAYGLGAVLEAVHGILLPGSEPRITRFLAKELATSHWFDIGAARRDLGYNPRISTEAGLERLAAWLRLRPF
jgi:nucleoside-diphosphate-sugar epimerase